MGMTKRSKKPEVRDVIEDVEIAAAPDRVIALLGGKELASWRHKKGEIAFRFDLVGEHIVARLRVNMMTPAFIALACVSTSVDLGWTETRVHLAVARTANGARVALVHAGVPANGATREVWRGLLQELKSWLEAAAVAA